MSMRRELIDVSDKEIEEAVRHADPTVLRGLLYQLTGDDSVAATKAVPMARGLFTLGVVADSDDIALLQAKTVQFLRAQRNAGGEVNLGATERLQRSINLAAGEDILERDNEMWLEELALHQFARGVEWPKQPDPVKLQAFHVLVIGTGLNGLNVAAQLKHVGIPFTIIEKNSEVGGTWWENRYPGARVDTPSRAYTLICGAEYSHPYAFSPQGENLKYTQWVADRFELRPHIEFDTEVKSLTWDESTKLWEVRADSLNGPRTWHVNVVISAIGYLNRPNEPKLEGAQDFKGEIFHTARWPDDLDIRGKRVAVIGSGCSGYQIFPEIARVAEHTYLFQRTPSWVFEVPNYLNFLPPQVNWLERILPGYRNFLRFRARWSHGPSTQGPLIFDRRAEINEKIREQRIAFMRQKFKNYPELFEKMLPHYPPNASRPVLVDSEYSVYDALMMDNTTLVTDGITQLTRNGILDTQVREYDVDIIALATGFKANEFLSPMDVRGRGGKTPQELWAKDGPRAYLGALLPDFPNLFMVYGPNTNPTSGAGNPAIHEMVTRFIVTCLANMISHDKQTVEVTFDGYEQYNNELDEAEGTRIYTHSGVKNYYTNEFGRSAVNCPFDARKIWEWSRDPTGRYAETAPGISINADSQVRPYFGQDIVVE
jgi:4-hydroxyacetophenone monooxygenase